MKENSEIRTACLKGRGILRLVHPLDSWGSALFFAFAFVARAQNNPHLGYVYPAGGRQGDTFQVVVGGQFLVAASNAFVSGSGIEARFLEYNRPLNQNEFNQLRDKLRELQQKRQAARQFPNTTNTWTTADENEAADLRARILKNPPNRQGNPAIAETVTLQVTPGTNAEAGTHEIRLGTPNGLSNPLAFRVGELTEFSKPLAKAASPDVARILQQFGGAPVVSAPTNTTMPITLPTIVNGQIMPGAVDRFHFKARKGQQLVAVVSARDLLPYLADAVPGWFQATLAIYDAAGKELAYSDDFRFNPDPVLHCEIPSDGEYVIEIKDAIYRGREDFVYRIAIGELAFVTSRFPLGGPAGKPTVVELQGWNLPTTRLTNVFHETGTHVVSVRQGDQIANAIPFAVDTLPELLEREPNDATAKAQAVKLPLFVNGRIDRPGDVDVFRFEGRAGDEIVAEVCARRLNSPLDSVLRLTDAAGKQVAFNDDTEDKGSGLQTHHADSYLRAKLPASATYFVHLGDTQHKGGAEFAYRLRLSPPRPDFELRVVPSSLVARAGSCVPLTVYAFRKDGFTNAIELTLKGAPAGFSLSGARIPVNQDEVRFTLAAPASLGEVPVSLAFEGSASIAETMLTRPIVPADDRMQAFAYHHLVPAQELCVSAGRGLARAPLRILSEMPLRIPVGGIARFQIGPAARQFTNNFHLELSDPPEGISLERVAPGAAAAEIVLRSEGAKVKPGQAGNLIVNLFPARAAATGRGRGTARPTPVGTLPAIPFEIVAE